MKGINRIVVEHAGPKSAIVRFDLVMSDIETIGVSVAVPVVPDTSVRELRHSALDRAIALLTEARTKWTPGE